MGFLDVVRRPRGKTFSPVVGHGVGGDGHDGQVAQRVVPAKFPGHGVSVHERKLNVQENHVRNVPQGRFDAPGAVHGLGHDEPVLFQKKPHQIEILFVILDDENVRALHAPPSSRMGMRNVKVLPEPGVLSTEMEPPMSSPRRLLMCSPSPVPSYSRVFPESTC
jgi:hypothetical protein